MSNPAEPETAVEAGAHAGRRRAASRHRSSWSGPLPSWQSWLLRRGLPLVSLAPALLATLLVQGSAPARLPSGAARFAFAGADLAVRPGALDGYGSPFTTPVVAWLGYGWLERALLGGTAQPVAAAVRGVLVLLALATIALLWLLARRLGASGLAAGAAAGVLGVAPIAVAVHAVPTAADLAAPALLGAGLLLTVRRHALLLAATAGVLAGAAILVEPAAIAALPALAVPVAVGARYGGVRRRLVPAGIALLAVAGIGVLDLLVLAARPTGGAPARALDALGAAAAAARPVPSAGGASGSLWLATDPLALLVAAVAIVVAATLPGGRMLAATAALLLAVSVWPLGAEPLAVPALVLPIVALAIALVVDRGVVALGSPTFLVSLIGAGWLMGVAALLVVALVVCVAGLLPAARDGQPPTAQAAAWVRSNVPRDQVVLVDVASWADTARGAQAEVAWYAPPRSPGAVPSSVPWGTADYVLAEPGLRGSATGAAAAVLRSSVVIRTFGTGDGAVQVRARSGAGGGGAPSTSPSPTPSPTSSSSAGPSKSGSASPSASPSADAAQALRAAEARQSTGTQLARNPRIVLRAADRDLLRRGVVDSRITLALGQLASMHTVTVTGFPAGEGDKAGVRRRMLIGAIDGVRVPGDATQTGVLLRYLSALQPPYAPQGLDARDEGVLASFSANPTFVPSP